MRGEDDTAADQTRVRVMLQPWCYMLALRVALVAAVPTSAAELTVANGSFEEPVIPDPRSQHWHPGPAAGWGGAVAGPSLQWETIAARRGRQAAFINDPKMQSFGQTLPERAKAGEVYRLEYYLYRTGAPGHCKVVGKLLFGDVVVASDEITTDRLTREAWALRAAEYVAKPEDAGKRIRIEFVVDDLSPDAYTRFVMDEVRVYNPPPPPPRHRPRDYYVARTGSDDNDGTRARPFLTIQRAASEMQPGDACYVGEGTYHETVRPRESGEKGKPIRFVAQPGEQVILTGAEAIAGTWEIHKERIYNTKVAENFSQLFLDGEMMVEAQWPNQPFDERWDKDTWASEGEGSEYGKVVDPRLAETGIDWTGALATLNVGSWQTYLRAVRNHAAGSGTFEYDKDLTRRLELERKRRPGFNRYFLWGKLEALDAPGEWFLDRESRTLYLWPPDGKDPSGRRIEGKTREYAFVVDGLDHIEINGFQFFAATFVLENASDCVVENCGLRFPTYVRRIGERDDGDHYVPSQCRRANAQFLGGLCSLSPTLIAGRRNVVRNCRIAFSEAPGLLLSGSDNTIENCLIHDIDWRGLGNGAAGNLGGVHMGASARSSFRRNTVHNVGSSEAVILPTQGPSICEYNYIHHGGLVQSDGALIQCHGLRQNGTVIRYNWVHDHNAFNWGGNGIRGDDLTRDLIVHHNVAWNCNAKGIIVKGDRNQVYNNSCFNNLLLDIVLWSEPTPHKEWAPGQWAHLLQQQNANSKTINNYAPVLTGQMPHEVRRARELKPPLGELSNNYVPRRPMLTDPRGPAFREDEPVLVNPAGFDFRPRPGSALIDAGRLIEGITERLEGRAPDIGAYESGDAAYWIPGYQAKKASRPIPPDGAAGVPTDGALIWLGGYGGEAYHVYLGASEAAVAKADTDSAEFKGTQSGNVFSLRGMKLIAVNYWRIDTVVGEEAVRGEVWRFTCGEED